MKIVRASGCESRPRPEARPSLAQSGSHRKIDSVVRCESSCLSFGRASVAQVAFENSTRGRGLDNERVECCYPKKGR